MQQVQRAMPPSTAQTPLIQHPVAPYDDMSGVPRNMIFPSYPGDTNSTLYEQQTRLVQQRDNKVAQQRALGVSANGVPSALQSVQVESGLQFRQAVTPAGQLIWVDNHGRVVHPSQAGSFQNMPQRPGGHNGLIQSQAAQHYHQHPAYAPQITQAQYAQQIAIAQQQIAARTVSQPPSTRISRAPTPAIIQAAPTMQGSVSQDVLAPTTSPAPLAALAAVPTQQLGANSREEAAPPASDTVASADAEASASSGALETAPATSSTAVNQNTLNEETVEARSSDVGIRMKARQMESAGNRGGKHCKTFKKRVKQQRAKVERAMAQAGMKAREWEVNYDRNRERFDDMVADFLKKAGYTETLASLNRERHSASGCASKALNPGESENDEVKTGGDSVESTAVVNEAAQPPEERTVRDQENMVSPVRNTVEATMTTTDELKEDEGDYGSLFGDGHDDHAETEETAGQNEGVLGAGSSSCPAISLEAGEGSSDVTMAEETNSNLPEEKYKPKVIQLGHLYMLWMLYDDRDRLQLLENVRSATASLASNAGPSGSTTSSSDKGGSTYASSSSSSSSGSQSTAPPQRSSPLLQVPQLNGTTGTVTSSNPNPDASTAQQTSPASVAPQVTDTGNNISPPTVLSPLVAASQQISPATQPTPGVNSNGVTPSVLTPAKTPVVPKVIGPDSISSTLQQAHEIRKMQEAHIRAQQNGSTGMPQIPENGMRSQLQASAMSRNVSQESTEAFHQNFPLFNGQNMSMTQEEIDAHNTRSQQLLQQSLLQDARRLGANVNAQLPLQHPQPMPANGLFHPDMCEMAGQSTQNAYAMGFPQGPRVQSANKRQGDPSPVEVPSKRARVNVQQLSPDDHQRRAFENALRAQGQSVNNMPLSLQPELRMVRSASMIQQTQASAEQQRLYAQQQAEYAMQQVVQSPLNALGIIPSPMMGSAQLQSSMAPYGMSQVFDPAYIMGPTLAIQNSPSLVRGQNTGGRGRGKKKTAPALSLDTGAAINGDEPSITGSGKRRGGGGGKRGGKTPGSARGGKKGGRGRTSIDVSEGEAGASMVPTQMPPQSADGANGLPSSSLPDSSRSSIIALPDSQPIQNHIQQHLQSDQTEWAAQAPILIQNTLGITHHESGGAVPTSLGTGYMDQMESDSIDRAVAHFRNHNFGNNDFLTPDVLLSQLPPFDEEGIMSAPANAEAGPSGTSSELPSMSASTSIEYGLATGDFGDFDFGEFTTLDEQDNWV